MSLVIRPENKDDYQPIDSLTSLAFASHQHSSQNEHFIIRALRVRKQLSLSLVAQLDGEVVGHIAFSPVQISDRTQGWYGLGPMAVLPEHQKSGIGSKLVRKGLTMLQEQGAFGCVVLGEPAFYTRFGFEQNPRLIFEGAPCEYFLSLRFTDSNPQGTVLYKDAFYIESEKGLG